MRKSIAVWFARFALVLAGLLVAEGVLQAAAALSPAAAERLSGLKPRYIADPVLDVRGDPESPEYDDAGFRNAERLAHASVVAIGDSQTEGNGVARENSWPAQLTRMTGVDVYQLAFGSYGPGQYVNLIDDALALSPTTVIVALYLGNDLADAYEWVYAKGRNPELRSTDPAVLRAVAEAERQLGPIDTAWRETRDAEKGLADRPILRWLTNDIMNESKLVALYDQLEWRMSGQRAKLDADAAPARWEDVESIAARASPDLLFPYVDGDFRTVFTSQGRITAMNLDDPRIAEGLRITLAVVDRITRETSGRARLAVLIIPTKEMVFARRVTEHAASVPPAFTRRIGAETRIRATLVDALERERGIRVIDALPSMRAAVDTEGPLGADSPLYPQSWDGHPAAAGHEAIARAVADAYIVQTRPADSRQ